MDHHRNHFSLDLTCIWTARCQGSSIFFDAYEFAENEVELQPASSSARSGGPPHKFTAIGILDPPVPPRRPAGRIPVAPASLILRILGSMLLLGLAEGILFLLFARS